MKKLFATLVAAVLFVALVGAARGGAAAFTPEGRACTKLEALCGDGGKRSMDAEQCREGWSEARKLAGDAATDRSLSCVVDAKTCSAAAGCLAGGVGVGAVGEMLKGFGDALSR